MNNTCLKPSPSICNEGFMNTIMLKQLKQCLKFVGEPATDRPFFFHNQNLVEPTYRNANQRVYSERKGTFLIYFINKFQSSLNVLPIYFWGCISLFLGCLSRRES